MGSPLDSMVQILKGWEICERPISQLRSPTINPNLQRTRACPTEPVDKKDFSSLHHLWARLVGLDEDSPSTSCMEAKALSPTRRKDPPGSRRHKFGSTLKHLYHWDLSSVNDGLVATAESPSDHPKEHLAVHEAKLGSLLLQLETRKIPLPGTHS